MTQQIHAPVCCILDCKNPPGFQIIFSCGSLPDENLLLCEPCHKARQDKEQWTRPAKSIKVLAQ